MSRKIKRSKAGITAGVLFFAVAVVFIILLVRVLTGTSIEDGLIPISIIFAGFATAFTLSGIFTLSSAVQLLKALAFMVVTLLGIVTRVSPPSTATSVLPSFDNNKPLSDL